MKKAYRAECIKHIRRIK